MKALIIKLIAHAVWYLHLYTGFSKLFRKLFDRKYVKYAGEIPKSLTPKEATEHLINKVAYKPDPIKGVLDVVRHPGWVEFHRSTKIETPYFLDCDEYATWLVEALRNQHAIHLSLLWLDQQGKFHGHVVATWRTEMEWWTSSNWGLKGPYPSFKVLLADHIGEGGEFLYAAAFDRYLDVLIYGDNPTCIARKLSAQFLL